MEADLAFGLQVLESSPASGSAPSLKEMAGISPSLLRGWMRQNQVTLAEVMLALAEAERQPLHLRPDPIGAAVRQPRSPYNVAARIFCLGLNGISTETEKVRANAALTRVAIAARQHFLRTGALPPSLDALRDAMGAGALTDPFNGKPFGFRARPEGLLLWSIGTGPDTPVAEDDEPSEDSGRVIVRVPK